MCECMGVCMHSYIHVVCVCVCACVCACVGASVCVWCVCVCMFMCGDRGKGEASSAHISADMSLANLIGSKQVSHSQSNQSNIISHDQVKH